MKYELYHDESKQGGFWHGMLLVPKNGKNIVLNYLEDIRENSGYQHKIELKKVKKESKLFHISESWIHIGIAALISKKDAFPYPLPLPKTNKGKKEFKKLYEFVGAKFIVFREKDNLKKMSNCLDYGGKVETTFRIGLKGGLHFLGNENEPINIEKIHFDGHEHYSRNVDKDRIVGRLYGLRPYCNIERRL